MITLTNRCVIRTGVIVLRMEGEIAGEVDRQVNLYGRRNDRKIRAKSKQAIKVFLMTFCCAL